MVLSSKTVDQPVVYGGFHGLSTPVVGTEVGHCYVVHTTIVSLQILGRGKPLAALETL